ncbi:uncharacterized protein PHALS_09195 [Plasmopara halstedii]|uniref:Uncharacterized protein n=1 Tax=Plasmopara halstedii TaxID=4781 RepID=A0A0N7L4N1_PLAHL|nr:uncharacterized protein PHALS_09195 [Plasmopara halstedii]CEG39139.1 hypothetical protein PHALS_09195 [Plasmopara halstedii]|eukprot:XP_024575508.1 hypothetical protein PHALS_09195 [Plasmopara halstedii]
MASEELVETKASDELGEQGFTDKMQSQASADLEKLTLLEQKQTVEVIPEVFEAFTEEYLRWQDSFATLDEAKQAERKRTFMEEQYLLEQAKLNGQIEQLKERCGLAELERLRALDTLDEQQTFFLKQLDECDLRFAQHTAEYYILQTRCDQLQQAYSDAQIFHENSLSAKQHELTKNLSKLEHSKEKVASLENSLKVASLDEDNRQAKQGALLRFAEQVLEKQDQPDDANAHRKVLEDKLARVSTVNSDGDDYGMRIRGLQKEIFAKSEQLVLQGERHLYLGELLNEAKSELVRVREEVGNARCILLRGIGLDPIITSCNPNTSANDTHYQHVKLDELIRLRLQAFRHELQLAGGFSPSISPFGTANDVGCSTQLSTCHMPNIERFTVLEALGLGSLGRLEREMRMLRSRNKRLLQRTDQLEGELETSQIGLRDLQFMREKVVEMASRERLEKDSRTKSEQINKQLSEKVAALSRHVEKLMVHLKHEAAAKTRAVEAQRLVEKELGETKDKMFAATRKYIAQETKTVQLEQGARILEDQLRLMDEKCIDVRNKLDWTRSAARKANKQLLAENRLLHMQLQLARDSATLREMPDRMSLAPNSRKSKKLTLGASRSESRLPTAKLANIGFLPVVASMVQNPLAVCNDVQVNCCSQR